MSHPILVYIGHIVLEDKQSPRLWDVVSPRIRGYTGRGYPTLSLEGLKEHGLLNMKEKEN